MGRQRNPHRKEKEESPEKQINEMKASNISNNRYLDNCFISNLILHSCKQRNSLLSSGIWQRDQRDMRAIQPDAGYYNNLVSPRRILNNPMNAVPKSV
ncbi:hypothetical protein QTO34_016992 [Cnephaeus nilssonii]|uniref:Uncharacterized protein n=1 Tax=Cnephaeus nilssonii TaxID=3371016 RepID=A0AA40I399_CNENI|nr:hypothetical protein QTO34_016992 [Eptesicus nilssonii]